MLPSVSWKYAIKPMLGTSIFPWMILQPLFWIFWIDASMLSTFMVRTGPFMPKLRSINPPLIAPNSLGMLFLSTSTVPRSVYFISGTGVIFQSKVSL